MKINFQCKERVRNIKKPVCLYWYGAYTVGVKSMSPVDIELLLVILYNITSLHHNINTFSMEIN